MAIAVQLSGHAGSGKTSSLRRAEERYPGQIVMINTDGKSLPWTGWRKTFSRNKENYFQVDKADDVEKVLRHVSDKMPHVKCVCVDTINTIMSNKEMRDQKLPGYNKWADLAAVIYRLYNIVPELREDLIVCFTAHIEPYEVNGATFYRTKTVGQKLTKLNLNSKLAYNLYTQVERDGKHAQYKFITQSDGTTEARSVDGVLEFEMDNDFGEVIHRIRKFDLGIEDPIETTVAPAA